MINRDFCDLQTKALSEGAVLVHASAVTYKDSTALFCGASGSGKTQTAIDYCHNGWKLISDDFVKVHNGRITQVWLEPMHMKVIPKWATIPNDKRLQYYYYWVIRKMTFGWKKPHIFMTPEELGIETATEGKVDVVFILGQPEGRTVAEQIFNTTKTKGGFHIYNHGLLLPRLAELIDKEFGHL